MISQTLVPGILTLSLFMACGCERGNGPAAVRPRPPVLLKSFALYDIQGLFGGCAIWVAADRTAVVQIVDRPPAGKAGLWERRYSFTLTPAQWAEMERLIGANYLLAAKMPERPGVPDEARPTIMLVSPAGVVTKFRKWANDKQPHFDPVYDYLRALCRPQGEPIREGEFEWGWRAPGFAAP